MPSRLTPRSLPVVIVLAAALLASCGGNRGLNGNGPPAGGGGQAGAVTLTLSDPAVCGGGAPYTAVYLTITDIEASPNANAAPGDASFVDLTPNLKSAPMQINLVGGSSQCTLATLANAVQATAQKYAQIRVFLAPDSAAGSISANNCGSYANCATATAPGSTTLALVPIAVGTAATNGIAITGAALDGGFTVSSGATTTVNVNFDICADLAPTSGTELTLNPAPSAGAINAQADTISGTFQDGTTHAPVTGPVLVALEQNQSGTDRVLMQTFAAGSGSFQFCPVPAGNYEVVAGAVSSSGGQYSPTAVLQVPNGASMSSPPLPLYAGNGTNGEPATISATVTSSGSGSGNTPVPVAASLTLQEKVTPSAGATYSLAIPLPAKSAAVFPLATATGSTCAAGTACVGPLTLQAPALFVSFGQYAAGAMLIQNNTNVSAAYLLDAQASVLGGAGQPDCTPVEVTQTPGQISPNANLTAPPLAFTGCQ
jgi:hypothetical protein